MAGSTAMAGSAISNPPKERLYKMGETFLNYAGKQAATSRKLQNKAENQDRKLHLFEKLKKPQTEKAGSYSKKAILSPA